jgi:hypothetical protein
VPSRKPPDPLVVDAGDWLAVLRPDHGHVRFEQAVAALHRHGAGFQTQELDPAVFVETPDGNYRLGDETERGSFVGWLLR